ncbi:MAG: serine--tRNA ligase [Oscillospiraceae bacterium]|nr:serine--tRNA ligase [Oscillospiraceae bacterium]MBQ7768934.1 serine--tRNA ligase [Oscillospiraceae bacterium]
MLDIRRIKENPDAVKAGLKAKEVDCDAVVDQILVLDEKIRALKTTTETKTAEKNKLAKENGKLFGQKKGAEKKGEDTSALEAQIAANSAKSVELDKAIEEDAASLKTLSDEFKVAMLSLPNLPDPDLVPGGKEANEPLRYIGEKPSFDFEPKHHVDLCTDLGLIDYERGVKLAGAGNWMYTGMGARLEWALLNYFIDTHTADGYDFILPPHMLEYMCGETAGQFPKFADEVYKIANPTDDRIHYMLPTAEAALASLYRDEILSESDLPKKLFAYTPCFRREAGSHRADERGMVRGHQFNKVEMFQFCKPEDSDAAFDELVTKAEKLVEGLGFHFRTVKLAAGDCSASMARTYDIEILIPSMDGYKEVSSVSNARDYQARRGNIRFRRESTGKPEFVHTLNGSGLATSRIFPALVEQNQRADGSIVVPEVLRKYLGGLEVIEKK